MTSTFENRTGKPSGFGTGPQEITVSPEVARYPAQYPLGWGKTPRRTSNDYNWPGAFGVPLKVQFLGVPGHLVPKQNQSQFTPINPPPTLGEAEELLPTEENPPQ